MLLTDHLGKAASFASPATYGAIGTTFSTYGNGDLGKSGHAQGSFVSNGPLASGTEPATTASQSSMPRQSSFTPPDPMDDFAEISPRLSDVSIDSNREQLTPPSSLSASSAQERGVSSLDSGAYRNSSSYFINYSHGHSNENGSMGMSILGAASIANATSPPGMAITGSMAAGGGRSDGRSSRTSRRGGVNRDEFDGPHQFLPRPSPQYIAQQERELPHLPTNLLVQEQDSVLSQVNDRLSQCAFDFVARYQFPVPLTQDMRPVARPQDREWTEWVQLLKRLATKRRIPARVLYNGQIKQFVTILENSLEMRHAARHQSRPLKDDRNILQLISAGIQVAKILKDAPAMSFLDQLYIATDQQIQERSASAAARFRS
ncbi:hypothetical protein SBRCBS47491_004183 [Sporothrix bragantina]|uniref:Uncharacterized protein n=1 Tax=Sporothrix bragantina TaxID=671064 RepID=A0ABP0BLN1_9PEZI